MSSFSSLTSTYAVPSTPAPQRARRRTAFGIVLSVLVHIVLFMVLRAKLNEMPPPLTPAGKPDTPLQVTFIQPPAPVRAPSPPQTPKKAPAPPKKAVAKPAARPARSRQTQVARAAPTTQSPTAITAPPQPAAPEMDFSSMINRNRERRQAAEDAAAQENAAARAAENPSANDIARANIAFSEQRARGGQNGVFEIVSKGPRVAQYAFLGWTNNRNSSRKQYIEVDAGPGGNVDLAIVDSMIALIRKYYSGDFNWDSQRLGRVVVLSARQSDTRGLQDFLLKEFFSTR